jgi:excisionase family DNA binding protein
MEFAAMIDRIENPIDESVEAARPAKKQRKPLRPLTIAERLEVGNFTLPEAAQLCACGISSLHKAVREGRLEFVKMGGCTRIRGPELSRYMNTKRGE